MKKFQKFVVVMVAVFMALTVIACDDDTKDKSEYPVEIQRYCEIFHECGAGIYDNNVLPEGSSPDAWTSESSCREYLWKMKQVEGIEEDINEKCYEALLDDVSRYEYNLDKGEVSFPAGLVECGDYVHEEAYFDCYPEGY